MQANANRIDTVAELSLIGFFSLRLGGPQPVSSFSSGLSDSQFEHSAPFLSSGIITQP